MLEKFIDTLLLNLNQVKKSKNNDTSLQHTINLLISVSDDIKSNVDDWEFNCKFNLKELRHIISGEVELLTIENMNQIIIIIYRFLSEYLFMSQNIENDRKGRLNTLKNAILDLTQKLDERTKLEINHADYGMIPSILQNFFSSDDVKHFRNLSQNIDETKNALETLKKVNENIDKSTTDATNNLKKFETAFNFVGLYQGFSSLAKAKINEKNWLKFYLIGIGLLILSPLMFEIWQNSLPNDSLTPSLSITLLKLTPIASIEILLIYYFRVILFNFNSTKTQILQLELRMTLCQFIQDYAKYSTEIKKNDPSALEKFENVIFSGLLADVDKLPSTYDGIEQLTQIFKSLKTS